MNSLSNAKEIVLFDEEVCLGQPLNLDIHVTDVYPKLERNIGKSWGNNAYLMKVCGV